MPPVPKSPASTSPTKSKPAAKSKPAKPGRPTEPPANRGAAIGRKLDNAGRNAGEAATDLGKSAAAPVVSRAQRAAISGGSIVVGLVAYAVGVAYLQHGWPGVTGWLKAKLFNETSQAASVVPAMLFHTGPGAGGGSTAGMQTAAAPPPQQAAPTPNGGILFA